MRARAMSVLLSVAAAAVALAAVAAVPGARAPRAALELRRAAGSVVLADDREGAAILRADGLRPGGQASGEVTLRNQGDEPLALVVSAAPDRDVAGLGGGLLSAQLEIAIVDVSDPSGPQLLASGAIAALSAVSAGTLDTGRERRFRVVATLPASAGNDVQGARLEASVLWTATAASGPPSDAAASDAGSGSATPAPATDAAPRSRDAPVSAQQ